MKTFLRPKLRFPDRPKSIRLRGRLLALAGWGVFSLISAAPGVRANTVLDFPYVPASSEIPVGLADWPRETTDGLLTIRIPFLPLEADGSVLATVIFQDDEARVIQARWEGGESVIISHNLSEGIKGWNQRTLKIPYELLQNGGTLVLETDADTQPVRRVTLNWTWLAGVYMGKAAQTVEYVVRPERSFTDRDLSDQLPGPVPDTVSGGIWKAYLQEQPEPLDEALEFAVPLDAPPQAAILRAKFLGAGRPVTLWVNGRKLDPLVLEVPELASRGYFFGPEGSLNYAGWRAGAVVVPASYFQTGENSIVLEGQLGAYIKDALLELNFDKEGAPMETLPAPASVDRPPAPEPEDDAVSAPDLTLPPEDFDANEPLVIIGHE